MSSSRGNRSRHSSSTSGHWGTDRRSAASGGRDRQRAPYRSVSDCWSGRKRGVSLRPGQPAAKAAPFRPSQQSRRRPGRSLRCQRSRSWALTRLPRTAVPYRLVEREPRGCGAHCSDSCRWKAAHRRRARSPQRWRAAALARPRMEHADGRGQWPRFAILSLLPACAGSFGFVLAARYGRRSDADELSPIRRR